jgi:hypothetical protein
MQRVDDQSMVGARADLDENLGDARSVRRPGGERTNARCPTVNGQFMGADARHFRERTNDQPRYLALELPKIHASGIVRKSKDRGRAHVLINILKHFTRRANVDEKRVEQR